MRSSEKTNQLEQGGGIDQSCSQSIIENIGLVLDHQLLAHQHQQQHAPPQNMQHQASSDPFCVGAGAAFGGSTSGGRIGGGVGGLMYPEVLPWNLPPTPFNPAAVPQFHTVGRDTTTNTNNNFQHMMDPFLFPQQQQQQQQQQQTSSLTSPSPHHYAPHPFFTSRLRPTPNSLQFGGGYDGGSSDHLRILSDALGPMMQHGTGGCSAAPFGLQAELNKLTAQEIMDAKALAASKSHSEAERRRRERINNHLAKLRSLLPSTTKTDKASLLAEVIQHVKELKRQTSQIPDTTMLPTETDELTIDDASHYIDEADDHQYVDDNNNYYNNTNKKKFVIKASLCCDDRSDLLPELIKTLKTLRLKTLKAEITSLGGRVKNVLFITGDQDVNSIHGQGNGGGGDDQVLQYSISSIQEAFKAVMEKSGDHDNGSGGNPKRQRTNNNISILN